MYVLVSHGSQTRNGRALPRPALDVSQPHVHGRDTEGGTGLGEDKAYLGCSAPGVIL
jgi:hypothetical protein